MQTVRKSIAPALTTSRSAVSNGTRLLEKIDGRSAGARRFRDLVSAFETEVGGVLTEVERGLIKQAAALTMRAEQLQSDIVNGRDVDGDQLIRLTGTAKRILGAIAKKAETRKPPAPTLAEYAASRALERTKSPGEVD